MWNRCSEVSLEEYKSKKSNKDESRSESKPWVESHSKIQTQAGTLRSQTVGSFESGREITARYRAKSKAVRNDDATP
ncbi:MAG: hypothetical protein P4L53_26980 [Candidatus Obscuribacterales bacterium]|nr:hypothetical protein [Candidatus Obscuribacterales bacterium]